MNPGGGGILAAEMGKFGGQPLEAIVEALILVLEEHRDLTKRVSIVDLVDTQHTSRPLDPQDFSRAWIG